MAPKELSAALARVSQAYTEQKDTILRRSQELSSNHAKQATVAETGLTVDGLIIDAVSKHVVESYDSEYGGFGSQPKFPMVSALQLMLNMYQSTGEDRYRNMVEKPWMP